MAAAGGWVYVDDTDPSIVYSGGDWTASKDDGPSSASGVFDGTLHGASLQGITATLKFTGSEVGVIGTSGLTDVYGWPGVDFSIDGVQQFTNTFPSSISHTTLFTNVTFFDSPVTPGEHVLTITNLNGTAPNVFWFDYIFYMPLADAANPATSAGATPTSDSPSTAASPTAATLASPSGSTAAAASTSPAHSQSTAAGSLSGGGIHSGSLSTSPPTTDGASLSAAGSSGTATITGNPSISSPSSGSGVPTSRQTGAGATDSPSATAKSHTGAIIGGAVAGAVVVALIVALLALRCLRRRRENWDQPEDISPVDAASGAMVQSPFSLRVASPVPALSTSSSSGKGPAPRYDASFPSTATPSPRPSPPSSEGASAAAAPPGLEPTAAAAQEAVAPPPATTRPQAPSRSKSRVRALAERLTHAVAPAHPVQEVDSGFRLPPDGSVIGTLPPPYTPD